MFAPSALLALATTRGLAQQRHRCCSTRSAPERGWSQTHTFTPRGPPFHPQLHVAELHAEGRPLRRQSGHLPAARLPLLQVVEIAIQQHLQRARRRAGPILFYTGNESPVDEYVNNTGLMWELGEQLGALLVFAEHRYEPLVHPALRVGSQRWLCLLHHRAGDRRLGDHHRLAPQTDAVRAPVAASRRLVRRDARGLVPDEVPRRRGRRDRSVGADLAARGHRAPRDARHAGSGDHARRERGGRRDRPVPRQPARGVAADPAGAAHAPRPSAARPQASAPATRSATPTASTGGRSSPTSSWRRGTDAFESTYITYSVVPGKAYRAGVADARRVRRRLQPLWRRPQRRLWRQAHRIGGSLSFYSRSATSPSTSTGKTGDRQRRHA